MQGATDRGTHSSNTKPGSCLGLVHSTTDRPQAAVPHTPVPPAHATDADADTATQTPVRHLRQMLRQRARQVSRETKTTRPPLTRSIRPTHRHILAASLGPLSFAHRTAHTQVAFAHSRLRLRLICLFSSSLARIASASAVTRTIKSRRTGETITLLSVPRSFTVDRASHVCVAPPVLFASTSPCPLSTPSHPITPVFPSSLLPSSLGATPSAPYGTTLVFYRRNRHPRPLPVARVARVPKGRRMHRLTSSRSLLTLPTLCPMHTKH